MQDDPQFLFMFIGGGLGKLEVEEAIAVYHPPNIISLPYQSLDCIKFSLSAADLHVVTLGNGMPGIIHPCKVYGAMAVGRPVLLIGPRPSHVTDLIDNFNIGWQADHGDVDRVVAAIHDASKLASNCREEIGSRARTAVREYYSKRELCGALCDVVERGVNTEMIRQNVNCSPESHRINSVAPTICRPKTDAIISACSSESANEPDV